MPQLFGLCEWQSCKCSLQMGRAVIASVWDPELPVISTYTMERRIVQILKTHTYLTLCRWILYLSEDSSLFLNNLISMALKCVPSKYLAHVSYRLGVQQANWKAPIYTVHKK